MFGTGEVPGISLPPSSFLGVLGGDDDAIILQNIFTAKISKLFIKNNRLKVNESKSKFLRPQVTTISGKRAKLCH